MNSENFTLELQTEQTGQTDGRESWVHLVPAGTFRGKDGRGPWTLKDANTVVNATRQRAGRNQIAIDYEHQTQRSEANGKPAPAAGWIMGMQSRADGIWGLVQWTPQAAEMLANREYRYISPVFQYSTKTGEVALITGAGLTNKPNLDHLAAVANSQENQNMEQLEELRKLLGLDATADMAAIVAKVQALLSAIAVNSANPDPAQFVPIGDFQRAVAESNQLRQGITKADAETHVSAHIASGHIAPFMKEWAVSLCTVNKPAFDSFVAGVGPSVLRIVTPTHATSQRRPGSSSANENLNEIELAVCAQMGITAEELIKARAAD
ncbi:phage protease [Mesorhizobium sp. M0959]|uniref:phage protease n=1 Tax=Mesorhizobium sp. M0959 TaxID=2957034 RepID=UPI00333CB2EF